MKTMIIRMSMFIVLGFLATSAWAQTTFSNYTGDDQEIGDLTPGWTPGTTHQGPAYPMYLGRRGLWHRSRLATILQAKLEMAKKAKRTR